MFTSFTVTFDSNVLENVIDPGRDQAKGYQEDYFKIRQAIKSGLIHGFFSDTWITLEGIDTDHRPVILGSRQLVSSSKEENFSDRLVNSTPTITQTIGSKMKKNQIHSKLEAAKAVALSLGLRALKGAPRLGDNFFVKDEGEEFYAKISIGNFVKCSEKAQEVEISIAEKSQGTGINVGRCAAQQLGLKYLEENQITNCLWYQGLGFAKSKPERVKVKKAVAEWADGENLIRHIAYGIDVFCTRDEAKTSVASILDANHRQWLTEKYGVVFLTPSELAKKLLSLKMD